MELEFELLEHSSIFAIHHITDFPWPYLLGKFPWTVIQELQALDIVQSHSGGEIGTQDQLRLSYSGDIDLISLAYPWRRIDARRNLPSSQVSQPMPVQCRQARSKLKVGVHLLWSAINLTFNSWGCSYDRIGGLAQNMKREFQTHPFDFLICLWTADGVRSFTGSSWMVPIGDQIERQMITWHTNIRAFGLIVNTAGFPPPPDTTD